MKADLNLPDLERLPEVQAAVAGDASGQVLECTGEQAEAMRRASNTAAMLRELGALAEAFGLGSLDTLVIKAATRTAVVVMRSGVFVQAMLDPAQGTLQVERALGEWRSAPAAAGAPNGADPEEVISISELIPVPAEPTGRAAPSDVWTALRGFLVRGQLTDASALRGALGKSPDASPGGAPADADQTERSLDALLDGIGSVLAGDTLSGLRRLKEVASEAERNRSFRWLALHWGALAAVQCSSFPIARGFARRAVALARELDVEAQAVSNWAVAEVLLAENSCEKALSWAAAARVQFERVQDTWGLGRACFVEGRILGAMKREEEAAEAARRAWFHDAAWDEPPVFLARRALERGALDEAEELVRMVATASAERIRLIAQAVRQNTLGQADAIELLHHLYAAPSTESARALARIARAAPRLPVPREALGWMLLKVGRYAEAGKYFTALTASPLAPTIRSSVMLGLGCVAHAQQVGRPESRLHAAVRAQVEGAPRDAVDPGSTPVPGSLSGGAGLPGAGAVFSGKLNVFAVPDLLEFLRGARRTGLLLCSNATGTSALRFRDGRIAAAASPSTPGVGELLVRSRSLAREALEAVLRRQEGPAHTDGVLGEVLVREGAVAIEQVRAALREQIRLAVKELVGWRDGEFAFNHEEAGGEAEIAVDVDPQEVLLNALKELDEAGRSRALR